MRNTWNTLLNYESRQLLVKRYEQKHGKSHRVKLIAAEISAAITQARRYFSSAADADIVIKPLLLYYGVLGLSRSLILFSGHKKREANLDQSHGLTAQCWSQTLTATPVCFEDLSIRLERYGSFRELIAAVSNKTQLRVSSSAVEGSTIHPPLVDDALSLTFGELLERTPRIQEYVSRWLTNRPQALIHIHSVVRNEDDSVVWKLFCGEKPEETLSAVLGGLPHQIVASNNSLADVRFYKTTMPFVWSESRVFVTVGSSYIVKPFPEFKELCQIGAVFILSYILGMLARYHPSRWTALVRNECDDSALPTVQALLDYIEHRFPEMILDFMEAPDFP